MSDPAFAGKRERDTLLAAVELFRELDAPQSTNALALFLYVCENEGVNMSELAFVSRLHVATAARLARVLAGEDETMPARDALFEFRASPEDKRLKFVHLTGRGRELRDRFESLIARAAPIRPAA